MIAWGLAALAFAASLCAAAVRLKMKPVRSIPREINEAAFLRAIAAVESGNNPRAVGPMGERSMYQFTRDTWRLHSMRSIYDATNDPGHAALVAVRHVAYIRSILRQRQIEETVEHLAAAWHYGPNFARICVRTDYVLRVVNLYGEYAMR